MNKYNEMKAKQLGMPFGTAMAILKKEILFTFAKRLNLLNCFQCGKPIEDIKDFSIEHKDPWLHKENAKELFFSVENIAFSHLHCNIRTARKTKIKETQQVICAKCKKKFEKRAYKIRYFNKMGQVDFYCSKSCAGKDSGKGYGRNSNR